MKRPRAVAAYLDLARQPVQLEPRGEIHRLAPHVVGKFVGADDAGHHRPRGDADPDPEIDAVRGGEPLDEIGQAQRHARKPRQMVGLRPAHAGHGHIAIAGGLDLLNAMRRGQPVELGDHLVEERDGARSAEPLGKFGEADEIAEQDGGLGDAVGDALAWPLLQTLGDRLRQDVGEQRVGLGARVVGKSKGVADDQRDHAEGGDGGRDIEIGEQRRRGGDQRAFRRKEEPGGKMQREAGHDHRDRRAGSGSCRRWRRRPQRR